MTKEIKVRFHNEPNMKLVKIAVQQYLRNEEVQKVLFKRR